MFKYLLIFILAFTNAFAGDFLPYNKASVQLLNKLTGKYEVVVLEINKPYMFDGKLHALLRQCYRPSQEDEADNIAFIQVAKESSMVSSNKDFIKNLEIPKEFNFNLDNNLDKTNMIFSGWLYSSSPSLNFIEDYVYDITLIKCVV